MHRHYYEIEAKSHEEAGRLLGKTFGEFVREDVAYMRTTPHWEKKVKAARPYLTQTQEFFPQYAAELESYAMAANVSIADLWALAIEDELEDEEREKCTTVVTNGGTLVAHNEDWDEDAIEAVCLLKKTIGKLTLFEIYYTSVPLGGCAITINSNGYVQAINSLPPMPRQAGIPKNVIARFLSETSDPHGDLAKLRSLPRASGYNHLLVGPGGMVLDAECPVNHEVIAEPTLPFAHTNHFLSPELAHYNGLNPGKSTLQRHASACRLARPYMSIEALMELTGNTRDGDKKSILNKNTVARIVVDLENRIAKAWLRREKKAGWVDYSLDFIKG